MKLTTSLLSNSDADRRSRNGCSVSRILVTLTFMAQDADATIALPPASVIHCSNNEMCTENQVLYLCVDIVFSLIFCWLSETVIRSATKFQEATLQVYVNIFGHTFVSKVHTYSKSLYMRVSLLSVVSILRTITVAETKELCGFLLCIYIYIILIV